MTFGENVNKRSRVIFNNLLITFKYHHNLGSHVQPACLLFRMSRLKLEIAYLYFYFEWTELELRNKILIKPYPNKNNGLFFILQMDMGLRPKLITKYRFASIGTAYTIYTSTGTGDLATLFLLV